VEEIPEQVDRVDGCCWDCCVCSRPATEVHVDGEEQKRQVVGVGPDPL
jgi:hypothetical protein